MLSTKVKFYALSEIGKLVYTIQSIHDKLNTPQSSATIVLEDNETSSEDATCGHKNITPF